MHKDSICTSRDTTTGERSNWEAMEPKNLTLTLLEKITDNFSKERLLGHGAYGKVYKVRLIQHFILYQKGVARNQQTKLDTYIFLLVI